MISNAQVAEEWTSDATSVGDVQSSKVLDSFASMARGVAQGSSSEQVSNLGSIYSTYNARMDQLDALKALSENPVRVITQIQTLDVNTFLAYLDHLSGGYQLTTDLVLRVQPQSAPVISPPTVIIFPSHTGRGNKSSSQ